MTLTKLGPEHTRTQEIWNAFSRITVIPQPAAERLAREAGASPLTDYRPAAEYFLHDVFVTLRGRYLGR